jgi:multidrug efflux pump subunit AcrA (membrane-fusion protein)
LNSDLRRGKKLVGVLDAILDGGRRREENARPPKSNSSAREERAEELLKTGVERDVLNLEALAKKQLSFEDDEARRARDAQRQAKYERAEVQIDFSQKYDPFAGLNKARFQPVRSARGQPATPEQMAR